MSGVVSQAIIYKEAYKSDAELYMNADLIMQTQNHNNIIMTGIQYYLYPTEAILQRHLKCDISDIRQHWVITTC